MNHPATLILNGSPAARGKSMRLAGATLERLPGRRRAVHLYQEKIAPCLDCGRCAGGTPCPLDDAMPALVEDLARCDLLLLVSPLHFTSPTAPLIAFFSRLQPFWNASKRGATLLPAKPRAAGLVVTAGSAYSDMFRPARSVAAAACNSLGIRLAGMATAADTDTVPIENNAAALSEAAALADAMMRAIS